MVMGANSYFKDSVYPMGFMSVKIITAARSTWLSLKSAKREDFETYRKPASDLNEKSFVCPTESNGMLL